MSGRAEQEALRAALLTCGERELSLPKLSDEQSSAADALFEVTANAGCPGCHNASTSIGSLAYFTLESQDEFLKGIAFRHQTTRSLAERCFASGAAKDAILRMLTSRRTESIAGVEYSLKGKRNASNGGVPFFTVGSDEAMREQIVTFLSGGFEVPAQPGDAEHDVFYTWLKAGGRFSLKTHVDILVDAASASGALTPRDGRGVVEVR